MTRADIHKKYGISIRMPPERLYEELSPEKASEYEEVTKLALRMFEIVFEEADNAGA